jgi:hypothetical protein
MFGRSAEGDDVPLAAQWGDAKTSEPGRGFTTPTLLLPQSTEQKGRAVWEIAESAYTVRAAQLARRVGNLCMAFSAAFNRV